MAASVSGSVLSSLFHEHTNSPGDQEGFLLGQIVSHVKDTITDSQMSGCKVETVTNIYSFIPCPYSATFYDRSGEVLRPKLDALLQGRTKELVGWYKFRRNSSPRVSLKEHSLHRKLMKLLSPGQHDHFLFCLCTASTTTNCSTHAFDHSFQIYVRGMFKPVALSITNLGDSIQNEYKHRNNMSVNPTAGVYTSLVSKFIPEFTDENGQIREVNKMHTLAEKLQSQLQLLCNVVNKSERQLQDLESEITGIKSRLDSKREKERLKQPLPPSPVETPQTYLPVDMDTAGPPPYPNRQQKPTPVQSVFIPEKDSGGTTQSDQPDTAAAMPDILSIASTPAEVISKSMATKVTLLTDKPDSVTCQSESKNGLQGDNSANGHPPVMRARSLPDKDKQEESSKPADHFSFIDSVLKEAKTSTPTKSASLKLSDQTKKAYSLDEGRLSGQLSSAPPKPPRTFESGGDGAAAQEKSDQLNSSLADKSAPSTIDRNDRLRCKPVQRTRSRAQSKKTNETSATGESNQVTSESVKTHEPVSEKGENPSDKPSTKTVATQPPVVSLDSAPKVVNAAKKTRTRAQVHAERAAAAKAGITPATSVDVTNPHTKTNSAPAVEINHVTDIVSDGSNCDQSSPQPSSSPVY